MGAAAEMWLHLRHPGMLGSSLGVRENSEALTRTRARGMGPVSAERSQRASREKSACQMGANVRAGSWEELEPHGIRRIDHSGGPGANLELERSGENELTSPADQLGSHQRARWNDFIQPKAPFRTRARVVQLVPMAHYRASDEPSPRNLTSGPNEEAVLETASETVMKYPS